MPALFQRPCSCVHEPEKFVIVCEGFSKRELLQDIIKQLFLQRCNFLLSMFTKEKEVFMKSTDQSWTPSVIIG